MAEIWPRLRKKLQQGKKTTKSSKNKSGRKGSSNPFANIGLEKFTTILEDLQSKQQAATSLVERTTSSLSAARSISRSAQEWTASTLVRTATRCSPDSTKASQCSPPVVAPAAPVGELQSDVENSSEAAAAPAEKLQRDSENLSTDRLAQGCQEEVSTSNSGLPLGVRLPTRRWRSVASKSAFVMLVALGAFFSARAGKNGKPFAAVLSFSAVARIWRKGKVSARFMFSSMALYFLTPLRSYLITRIPKRLILAPQNPESSQSVVSLVAQPELRETLGFPVVAPSLSPISESSPSSESLNPVTTFPDMKNVERGSSSFRWKKISSRWKKLKMRRSSSSSVSVVRDFESTSSSSHAPSSPMSSSASSHRRMCPFSRKASDIAETQASEDTTPSSHDGSRSKCRLPRRHQSLEMMSSTSSNKVGEECSITSSSACESSLSTSSSTSASSKHEAAPVAWPMVGLLVTLLFLLVGRVPAIMATSFFFVVVSPHSRARDRRESRAYREAAARKLHRSPPPPRGGRWAPSSPPRSF